MSASALRTPPCFLPLPKSQLFSARKPSVLLTSIIKFLTGVAAVSSGGRNDIGTDRHFVGQVAGFVVSGETMDAPMVQCLFEMEQYDSPFPLSAFRFPCSIFQPANECQIYRMRAIYLIGVCVFACAARRCRAR